VLAPVWPQAPSAFAPDVFWVTFMPFPNQSSDLLQNTPVHWSHRDLNIGKRKTTQQMEVEILGKDPLTNLLGNSSSKYICIYIFI
jgi:hypothetical protein